MPRLVTDFLVELILPPGGPLLLCAAGFLLLQRFHAAGRILSWTGILSIWISSLGVVGDAMLRALEPAPAAVSDLSRAQALVVLGGGRNLGSPEFGEDTVNDYTLVRVRYAARIARETGLPVLVTGGSPNGGVLSEAETMHIAFSKDFQVPIRWIERESKTTAESAVRTYALLAPEGIRRIGLVSTAWHLPRASGAFRKSGFEVVPAPTGYISREDLRAIDFLPTATGMHNTRFALREMLGFLWYWCLGTL